MSYQVPVANPYLKQISNYQENEVLSASPEKLILMLYDQAILGCKRQDAEKASRAVAELINSLNFKYEEISTGLFRLYDYILREIKMQKYKDALYLLTDLRQTWDVAIQQLQAA